MRKLQAMINNIAAACCQLYKLQNFNKYPNIFTETETSRNIILNS